MDSDQKSGWAIITISDGLPHNERPAQREATS